MRSTAPAVMDVGENSEFFFLKYFWEKPQLSVPK